ncbi:MAG: fibronectin type III domain-containing protein [Promethearchaeota archaeon]
MVNVNTVDFNSNEIKRKSTTDDTGYFKIEIQTNVRKPRFVLNIWKEGYGLFSQIFFRGKQNGIWLLTKGTIHTIDPRKDNTIRDTPHITKFTGPLSRHIDISKISYRRLFRADKIAAIKKLLQPPPSYLDPQVINGIRDKGIQVTIKADTLVDTTNAKPPAGLVNVTLATVDILGPDSMPGDFTAVSRNGQIGYMITYGAGSVDVLANGKKYQLKEGSKAKIEIPLPKHLEGSKFIPKTIPFLKYNKKKGIWEEVGEATFNENTQVYTATTTKFSSFNMDILKNDQACLVINGTGIKKDYKLQVDFDYDDRHWTRYKYPNANEIYALYNLPPDTLYTLTAFKTELAAPLMIGIPATCTTQLQVPSSPPEPKSEPDFTFPACNQVPKPVYLSAARPDPPTSLTADDPIGCNYIDLSWTGNANGPAEGYIIKVYLNAGDPGVNPPWRVYNASDQDNTLRVPELNPTTTYYFHIHQYDEYASEDSEPCPSDTPLAVTTARAETFTITNKICDQEIVHVYFNDEPEEQELPPTGFGYDDSHGYSVCQRPDSVRVETPLFSFNFRNISTNSIEVTSLVKILPGNVWKTNDIPPLTIRKLVFQDENQKSFIYYDENDVVIDSGTFEEWDQDCTNGIISFRMYFSSPNLADADGTYDSSNNKIIIPQFPQDGAPPVYAEFSL